MYTYQLEKGFQLSIEYLLVLSQIKELIIIPIRRGGYCCVSYDIQLLLLICRWNLPPAPVILKVSMSFHSPTGGNVEHETFEIFCMKPGFSTLIRKHNRIWISISWELISIYIAKWNVSYSLVYQDALKTLSSITGVLFSAMKHF